LACLSLVVVVFAAAFAQVEAAQDAPLVVPQAWQLEQGVLQAPVEALAAHSVVSWGDLPGAHLV
jgi:hypothetical protein